MSVAKRVSVTGFMAALICVLTMVFQIYIYETHGYFNFGEIGVYFSALMFGPWVGAISGGLGSALADIFTGFFWYAPGTLFIKGFEGFVVGLLHSLFRRIDFKRDFKGFLIFSFTALSIYLPLLYIGFTYYSGVSDISFGLPIFGYGVLTFSIPHLFWVFFSMAIFILIVYVYVRFSTQYISSALSCFVGGLFMVLFYFLYEFYVLSYGWASLVEVPFNFMQMLIGLVFASMIYIGVNKRGFRL
ncbi:MAG: ECF transporter S component [Candidatus Methanomethylicia archaeon]